MYELTSESSFDGAHFLSDYYGRCENLHGHRWRVVAHLRAEALDTAGTQKDMVVDFSVFKACLRELTAGFDHRFLVERGSLSDTTLACLVAEGFRPLLLDFRTTAENLARWFLEALWAHGFSAYRVDVYETPLNCASYIYDRSSDPDPATEPLLYVGDISPVGEN